MKSVSGRQLALLAQRKGWTLARVQGSHHIFRKDDQIARLVIPVHGSKSLKSGLQRSLMKLIPLEENEL